MKRQPIARILSFAFLLPIFGEPGVARAAELAGRLTLAEGGKKPSSEYRQTVIYFTPSKAVAAKPVSSSATAEPPQIVMARKEFAPRVLAITAGSKVRFPNGDPILHNAFSVSRPNDFDLGLYRKGESRELVLEHPGVVTVFCNVHHAMVAYVLVLETPFFTQPRPDGGFRLEGLPAGAGTLTVWHERAEPWSRTLELPSPAPIEIRVEITKPKVPPHLNKFGKPYERDPRGRRYR